MRRKTAEESGYEIVLKANECKMAERPNRDTKKPKRFASEYSSFPALKKAKTNKQDLRMENLFIPSSISIEDRLQSFHGQILREIKRRLWSGLREDPDINFDLNVDRDVFMEGLGKAVPRFMERGKTVYRVKENRSLDPLFGHKWDERILNVNGDFGYVIEGTLKYWLGKRNPITEYKLVGNQYTKSEMEDSYYVALTFVRGDGNRHNYTSRN